MNILSVTGARPQFVKAAPLVVELAKVARVVSLHTGQHYDPELSQIFHDELGLPEPEIRLDGGSGSHGEMTARILIGVERALRDVRPDALVVYGDTDSTLAAALAGAKLHVPIVHVEAGLRSFDRRMPEEVNRVLVDVVSSLLLCPSQPAVDNLRAEGITQGVHIVGDVMVDVARLLGPLAARRSLMPGSLGLEPGSYLVATWHRASNTEPQSLRRIAEALCSLPEPIVLPLHPRTRAALARDGLLERVETSVRVLPPLGYLDFTALLRGARMCLTDSGGVQKEAYLHGIPCLTMRDTSEWGETVEAGWNLLVHDDPERIRAAVATFAPSGPRPPVYGDGAAAERIAALVTGRAWASG